MSNSKIHTLPSIFLAAALGAALVIGVPLICEYADVNHAVKDAASKGFNTGVSSLLHAGADIHADHDAALRWAAVNGQTQTVALLLDHGADIHAWSDYSLRWAAANGHTDTVRLLLDRGRRFTRMMTKRCSSPFIANTMKRHGYLKTGAHGSLSRIAT